MIRNIMITEPRKNITAKMPLRIFATLFLFRKAWGIVRVAQTTQTSSHKTFSFIRYHLPLGQKRGATDSTMVQMADISRMIKFSGWLDISGESRAVKIKARPREIRQARRYFLMCLLCSTKATAETKA